MDVIEILGKRIPIYGALGVLGTIIGILYLWLACRIRKKSFEDSLYVFVWAGLFAMVGAKILYLLIEADTICALIVNQKERIGDIVSDYLSGGFVFYGGLIGAIIGVSFAARYFSLNSAEEMNLCIPIMPLVHGFGRIGCHLVGCCYGIEYSGPLSRVYDHSMYAPNEVGLFPVQLAEAIFDFGLFAILAVLEMHKKCENIRTYIYLLSYSLVRFGLEFLRGDAYRGAFGGLSTSQWISILIIVAVMLQMIVKGKRMRKALPRRKV